MSPKVFTTVIICFAAVVVSVSAHVPVLADKATHQPLGRASVFDRNGRFVGTSGTDGRLGCVRPGDYPVTVRYMGYTDVSVPSAGIDTVFLSESYTQLEEVVVETRDHKMLHILAYVREFSTLTCFTDTVSMYREKMVDYMLPNSKHARYKGWTLPRVLNSRSYYRFSALNDQDSVSDRCNHSFSWSDWIGVPPAVPLPLKLSATEYGTDSLTGKYSVCERWLKKLDRISVDVNVVADTVGRRWVPDLKVFFRKDDNEFDRFGLRLIYDNVTGREVTPVNIVGYSFDIESRGRGREMFMFNRHDQPFFVSTHTEVYIIDKEFVTVKEAKKWEKRKFDVDEVPIIEPVDAPPLDTATVALITRVNSIDDVSVRADLAPDRRYVNSHIVRRHDGLGYRALGILKGLLGITRYRMNKHNRETWNNFKREQMRTNNSRFRMPDEGN